MASIEFECTDPPLAARLKLERSPSRPPVSLNDRHTPRVVLYHRFMFCSQALDSVNVRRQRSEGRVLLIRSFVTTRSFSDRQYCLLTAARPEGPESRS